MSLPARSLSLETLRLEQEGRVLTAWYSSPPLNFATAAFTRDLDRLTRAVDRDDSVGAVVLTGGVEGRFLTHADPHELGGMMERPHPQLPIAALEPAIRVQNILLRVPLVARSVERSGGVAGKGLVWLYRWKRTFLRMNRSSTVYLAAMNGPTAGGGLETALGFDLRFLADADTIRVGQFETTVGLIPGGGGTQRLTHMLGTARALEHMLEGRLLSAAEALELGLVHRVIPAERLLGETQAVAARLSRRSPVATPRSSGRCISQAADACLVDWISSSLDFSQPDLRARCSERCPCFSTICSGSVTRRSSPTLSRGSKEPGSTSLVDHPGRARRRGRAREAGAETRRRQ